ncbi:MAG TPA: hypothetical protein VFX98_14635, partial [Longimicrobiaceae bacterium]|nr:hypothetical protein [Longimicrobiaceae bacterium]
VSGWYDLPLIRSQYITFNNTATNTALLAQHCAAAADPVVDFSAYAGIVFQFNGDLARRSTPPHDVLSLGGSISLALDGAAARPFGAAWISGAHHANYVVYQHEVGHGLGWPHSSGRYGQEYDSRWDVMSFGYLKTVLPWGSLSIHTIGPHKAQRGWVPEARRWRPAMAEEGVATLSRSALPTADGYLTLEIPLSGGGGWLMAEARIAAGYDDPLPGEAVVLHEVEGRRAYVVDPDANGNPNDLAAQWHPGETYADSLEGFALSVLGRTATGFQLSVRRGWKLSVQVAGTGSVSGGGLQCSADCAKLFGARGTQVVLTAAPAGDATFAGWQGACSGTGTCTVTLGGDRTVRATFAPPGGAITSDSVRPAGRMGSVYLDSLKAAAPGTVAWSLLDGALPEGVQLGADGVVGGVPAQAGTFRFTALVTGPGVSAARTFRLAVGKPTLQQGDVLDQLLVSGGTLSPDDLRFLDLLGNRNGKLDVGDVRAWLLDLQQANPNFVPLPALQRLLAAPAAEGRPEPQRKDPR